MSIKTVKPFESKSITAKELFGLSYITSEMYNDEEISRMKKRVLNIQKPHQTVITFFEDDGVIFYISTFVEEDGKNKGKSLTTINCLKDYSISNDDTFWKFGFVNKLDGSITLLFGGYLVAKNRSEAFHYFEIAKAATKMKFKKSKNLIPFAHKE